MRHTGSLRLSGSPRSFGLNPKCSHTAAVAFGFETNSMSQLASRLFALLCSRLKHSRLPTQSPCDWQAPPPHTKDNATDKRVHFSYAKETRVVIQSRITNKYANEIIAAGKIIEVIFFIVRFIDYRDRPTGGFMSYFTWCCGQWSTHKAVLFKKEKTSWIWPSRSGVPKHVPGASPTLHISHVSLSDTPISGLGVATNELMSWIRCDW